MSEGSIGRKDGDAELLRFINGCQGIAFGNDQGGIGDQLSEFVLPAEEDIEVGIGHCP